MPTIFKRRYFRKPEEVSRFEKTLGVLLILVLAGIVTAYAVQAARNRDYLFDVDESALRVEDERREIMVARQMLPPLEAAGWRAAEQVGAVPFDRFWAALADEASHLSEFETQWVYRRRYTAADESGAEITAMICDVMTPEQAFGLWRARQPVAAQPVTIGRGGWKTEDRLGFWNGRYYTELRMTPDPVGATMTLEAVAKALAAEQLSYGGPFEGTVAARVEDTQTDNPFPDPGVTGWQAPREPSHFTPDNLYVKIDGRAGLYLQFHVVGLTFGTYYHRSRSDRTVDVFWYDMGEPTNALGAYRAEEAHDAAPVSLGDQGYEVGGAVFFRKAGSYVQVLPAGPDQADADVALEIARRIAGRIEGAGQDLWASAVLPQDGRVPDSLDYAAENVFGLEFLSEVFKADYDLDGERITMFITRAGDEASAEALLDQYVAYFQEYGKVIWRDPDGSRRIVAGDTSGLIDVVFAKGRYLGGVAGADGLEPARKIAARFYDRITPE